MLPSIEELQAGIRQDIHNKWNFAFDRKYVVEEKSDKPVSEYGDLIGVNR